MSEKSKSRSARNIAASSADDLIADSKGVFRRLFGYIRPYRVRLMWGILFGILAGVSEAGMLLVLKTVFKVILSGPEGVAPAGQGIDSPTEIHPFENISFLSEFTIHRPDIPEWMFVGLICMSIPLMLLIKGIFNFIHQYCMIWLNMKVLHRLRDESYSSILRQSLSFFNEVKQGELIQTVANQTRTSADAGAILLSAIIRAPISIISIFVFLLYLNWQYTVGALVVFPLCIVPVALIARKVRKAGAREEEESEELMVTMHESFAGVRLIKAHSREDYQISRFDAANRGIIKFIMRWRKALEVSSPLVEIVGSLGIAIGLIFAWWTQIKPEDFLVLNVALMSIYPHAKLLSRINLQLEKCRYATAKVFAYTDAVPEVRDRENAVDLENCKGAIEFENVTFSYTEDRAALNDVCLRFDPGKKYALVGQSGSGKSTVLSLAMRFYDPENGAVKVDEKDIREYAQETLRDQIGLVSQDTFLFHDTIRNNIRYGHLEASDEEIEQAAKLAHAHEFIMEEKDGYETVLGDKGCTLSGGQQQRLSIARAILRNAPILFLDEATSALDSESEKIIQEALQELSKGKTVVAIAHRLSTVLDSDEIVVMRDGRVLDVAPHSVLLERCKEYKRLYQLQFEGEIAAEDGDGS